MIGSLLLLLVLLCSANGFLYLNHNFTLEVPGDINVLGKVMSNGVEIGLTGPQGPQGDQGIQGEQGIQGIQGPAGEDGITGSGCGSSTVRWGSGCQMSSGSMTHTASKTLTTSGSYSGSIIIACLNGRIISNSESSCTYVDVSCFPGHMRVTMADGEKIDIKSVKPGQVVRSINGQNATVIGIDETLLGDRFLYSLNELELTDEHPIWTRNGFAVINLTSYRSEVGEVRPVTTSQGQKMMQYKGMESIGQFDEGMEILQIKGSSEQWASVKMQKQEYKQRNLKLFSLVLDGPQIMFVEDIAVSGWASDDKLTMME